MIKSVAAGLVFVAHFISCHSDPDLADYPCDVAPEMTTDSAVLAFMAEELTGEPTFEHEVHDCQRLVIVDASGADPIRRYGPLVGVFPIDSLMAYSSHQLFADWQPVASVYNWSKERYEPLSIPTGWSCVFIRTDTAQSAFDVQWPDSDTSDVHNPLEDLPGPGLPGGGIQSTPPQWEAMIAPTNEFCGHREVPGNPPASLAGFSGRHIGPDGSGPYPVTARWQWDEVRASHLIGIKCGSAWCTFGPQGYKSTVGIYAGDPHRSIPGWYDEQHLALRVENGLVPGPLGRVYPTPALFDTKSLTASALDESMNAGMLVADIEIEGDSAALGEYLDKFDLAVANGVGMSSIWLMLDEGEPQAEFRNASSATTPEAATAIADAPPKAAYAAFVPQAQHAAIGAARWRWDSQDERVWVSCESGCCTVSAVP